MSNDAPALNQASSLSDSVKSLTLAQPKKAGATSRKSRGASKEPSRALKRVDLSGQYRINDHLCSYIICDPARENNPWDNAYFVKSLDHYGARILIDGNYWMPANSGIVVGWIEADSE